MIDIACTIQPNGDLVVSANAAASVWIRELQSRPMMGNDAILNEILEPFWTNGMYRPFDAGDGNPFVGLTSAPCIAEDMSLDDDGKWEIIGRLWWFPNYMVEDPAETLASTGQVCFTLAPEETT